MDEHLRWQELSREEAWKALAGNRHVDKVTYKMPDGTIGDYYLSRSGNSAVTLAMTKDQQVILAKQYRPGKDQVVCDLPGGGIKAGQTPEEAARAELLEETGYDGTFQFVTTSLPDGYSMRISHCFVATNCERVAEQKLDPHEFIEVVLMPLEEFKAYVRTGKMTDLDAAMLGLDFLKLL